MLDSMIFASFHETHKAIRQDMNCIWPFLPDRKLGCRADSVGGHCLNNLAASDLFARDLSGSGTPGYEHGDASSTEHNNT